MVSSPHALSPKYVSTDLTNHRTTFLTNKVTSCCASTPFLVNVLGEVLNLSFESFIDKFLGSGLALALGNTCLPLHYLPIWRLGKI